MLVCEPKFHSWGRCTMALTNMHSDLRFNPFSGLCINLVILYYIILYYIILYYIILYYIILYYIILYYIILRLSFLSCILGCNNVKVFVKHKYNVIYYLQFSYKVAAAVTTAGYSNAQNIMNKPCNAFFALNCALCYVRLFV